MCSCILKSLLTNQRYLQLTFKNYFISTLQTQHNEINIRKYSKDVFKNTTKVENVEKIKAPGAVSSKYDIFKDEDASIIFDVNEERERYNMQITQQKTENDEYSGINLQRGVKGVFDIEELVELLRRDNAKDIFVAAVPADMKYVDHMCFVTGKGYRHMLALAEFVRKTFKKKKSKNDIVPKIEGKNSKDWLAMDLGNIALHIFSNDARLLYDLDTLWAVGAKYDTESNKPEDPIITMLERHAIYLHDLEPKE